MTALQDPRSPEPEVLIEEARRRQRRRRATALSTAAVLAAGALAYGIASGGGPPPKHRASASGDASGASATPSWHDITPQTGYIGPRAQITSVIGYHGELVAAGERYGRFNPDVWVDDGGHWRRVFGVPPLGSAPDAILVASDHGLLLFQSGMGGRLWRSANGRVWHAVRIPSEMRALGAAGVASDGARVVVSLDNRFAGGPDTAYGERDPVWASTDGIHWHQDRVPDQPDWNTVDATARGFVAVGTDHASNHRLIWTSADGVSWSAAPVAGSGSALADLPDAPNAPGVATVTPVAGGFVELEAQPDGRMVWSAGGRRWTRVWGPGPLFSSRYFPTGIGVDDGSVVVAESTGHVRGIPEGATTFWRLDGGFSPRAG